MNAQNAKDYLPLVQALAEGKQLQLQSVEGKWIDLPDLEFRWPATNYRIKPEPRTLWGVYSQPGKLYRICETQNHADEVCGNIKGTISIFKEVV